MQMYERQQCIELHGWSKRAVTSKTKHSSTYFQQTTLSLLLYFPPTPNSFSNNASNTTSRSSCDCLQATSLYQDNHNRLQGWLILWLKCISHDSRQVVYRWNLQMPHILSPMLYLYSTQISTTPKTKKKFQRRTLSKCAEKLTMDKISLNK